MPIGCRLPTLGPFGLAVRPIAGEWIMSAEDLLRDGKVDETLAELQQHVRSDPSNSKLRVFLFQLLAVQGQWERALTQLGVIAEMDAGALAMVQTYREAIRCEILRQAVFSGSRTPLVFGEPQRWVAMLMEALRLHAGGQHVQGQELREQAFEAAPVTAGSILARGVDEPQAFSWIADADSRLGPVVEAVIDGRYFWVPVHRAQQIVIEEPADLRDVVWMPAHFVWVNGGDTFGLIPTRYVGSEASDDPQIRLARRTEWIEQGEGVYEGLGQRLLATDAAELPLMDVREITLVTAGEDAESAGDSETPVADDTGGTESDDG